MEPISPVVAEAYELLQDEIYRYLDDVVYLSGFRTWTNDERELVRRSIVDMSYVIRGLVVAHESSNVGNCKKCDTAWPCPVTESIHRLIKDPERVFYEILEHVRGVDSSVRA
jgi:hypothetical protein